MCHAGNRNHPQLNHWWLQPPLALLVGVADHLMHEIIFSSRLKNQKTNWFFFLNKIKDQKILKNITITFIDKSTEILRIKRVSSAATVILKFKKL
jgi:pyruvate carboxylase